MKKTHLLISLCIGGLTMSFSNPKEYVIPATKNHSTIVVDIISTNEQDTLKTSFGPEKVDTTKAISVAELTAQFVGKTKMKATFKGEINETCSKMGCWVNIDKGNGDTFKVRFKDHFSIPTNTKVGTLAYFTGEAIMDTISVDKQRYYLEDADASQEEMDAITKPKIEMTFIADGVELVR